jgi:two-component system, OmpR family, response regulator
VRILILDHDGADAAALARLLERSGFRVSVVPSHNDEMAEDVAVFDAVALGPQGRIEERAAHCQRLRKGGYLGPILAGCSDASEAALLLDAGADDFVTTPFEPIEWITRLRACARRAVAHSHVRWGALDVDRLHRVLRLRGRSIALTARECELLVCLIEAGDRVVSRAQLRDRLSEGGPHRGSNLVEVHLCRLREKLGPDAELIETVRRAGYRLRR